MRCDLHVHSWHSGPTDVPVLDRVGRECYSDPLDVYEPATGRGMDLVTLTDHDSVEGALGVYVKELLFGRRQLRAFEGAYGWPAGSLAGLETPSLEAVEAEAA